jgi:succinate dehydrogenase / fumarate reductase membrane anchor subunit
MDKKSLVYSWFFQRITGLLLIIGMSVHFLILHFLIEKPLTAEKVFTRIANSTPWLIFDIGLLFFTIYHGLNGTYQIILDWNPKKCVSRTVGFVLFFIGLATFGYGLYTLWGFIE